MPCVSKPACTHVSHCFPFSFQRQCHAAIFIYTTILEVSKLDSVVGSLGGGVMYDL